jgi:amidase
MYLSGIAQDAENVPFPQRLQRRTRGLARMGRVVRRRLGAAQEQQARHAERIGRLFDDFDVLLMPVSSQQPVSAGRWEGRGAVTTLLDLGRVYPFTGVWNYVGFPSLSIPGGLSRDGRPIGMQLVGRPGSEATLLALGAQLEAELDFVATPPGY